MAIGRRQRWLTIELDSPITANKILTQGVNWNAVTYPAARFCREGRIRQCAKCQRFGHVQSHCPFPHRCGRCAKDHSTRECPSNSDPSVPTTCANCGLQGHRPTNEVCEIRRQAVQRSKEILASCPSSHRVPKHFRQQDKDGKRRVQVDNVQVIVGGRNFQSEAEQQAQAQIAMSRAALAYVVDSPDEASGLESSQHALQEVLLTQDTDGFTTVTRKKRPGRPKGSKNKSTTSSASNSQPSTTDMQLILSANRSSHTASIQGEPSRHANKRARFEHDPSTDEAMAEPSEFPPTVLITSSQAESSRPRRIISRPKSLLEEWQVSDTNIATSSVVEEVEEEFHDASTGSEGEGNS
jgi:hypothetical protein